MLKCGSAGNPTQPPFHHGGFSALCRCSCLCLALLLCDSRRFYSPGENPGYNFEQRGKASYYANQLQGHPMASGEIYHADSLVAAHRYLPLGTSVLVTNPGNGRHIELTIKDRGPFHGTRILDVSGRAADTLGFRQKGIAEVVIQAHLSTQVLDSLIAKGLITN